MTETNPLTSEDQEELIGVIKDIISQERELEISKMNLAQNEDFNLQDAFSIIDKEKKGFVTCPQLQEVL